MKKIGLFAGILMLALLFGTGTRAAEFSSGATENGTVTIGAGETHRNLYTAGGSVTVNGNTQGDLIVAGGNVTLEGDVEKDVMLAGGTVAVNGRIGEDARIVGGNITFKDGIGGDLVVFGGNIHVDQQAEIGGDVVVAAGSLVLNAPVKGSLKIAGGRVEINNRVEGDVWVTANESLVFGSGAEVLGKVVHRGPNQAQIREGARVGTIEFTQIEKRSGDRGLRGILTAAFLIKLAAWILAGLAAAYVGRRIVHGVSEGVRKHPWENLGIGLAVLLATPFAAGIALLTVVGYYLAILIALGYVTMLAVVYLFSALVMGYFILSYLGKPGEPHPDWQAVVIGVVVWSLLKFIPVVGWVILLVVFLMTLGAAFRAMLAYFRPSVPPPPSV